MAHKNRPAATPQEKPAEPNQPTPNDQSGSTGRATPPETLQQHKDTGQGHYGQNDAASSKNTETDGQKKYRESEKDGDPRSKSKSNEGSGRTSADETTKDIPKTG